MNLQDSVASLKGVGKKRLPLLEKLHIRTLRDALETYPRDYEDRTHITQQRGVNYRHCDEQADGGQPLQP